MAEIKIVGLGGSLARRSTSLAALRLALEGAEEAGGEVELFDMRSLDLPFYVPGTTNLPPAAAQFLDATCAASGMIWSSPLYHGTISGVFKNALDWLQLLSDRQPAYLTDKVVGLISTAGGAQGLQAVNTMEFVVRALRGWAVPFVLPVPRAWQVFDEAGQPLDPQIAQQLRFLGQEVVRAAAQLGARGECDYSRVEQETT